MHLVKISFLVDPQSQHIWSRGCSWCPEPLTHDQPTLYQNPRNSDPAVEHISGRHPKPSQALEFPACQAPSFSPPSLPSAQTLMQKAMHSKRESDTANPT